MGSSPPQKGGSHFGDFVQRFAWACLLRPAGVRMLNEEPSSRSMSDEEEEEDRRNNNKGQAAPPPTKTKSNSSFKETTKEEAEDSFHEAESMPDYYFKEESDKLISDSSNILSMRVQALEGFIGEVFATVSALKGAYIQLQAAHSPFDPEKLRLADKAVIVELRRLSELKHSFKEKQQQHSARSHSGSSSKNSTSVEEQNEELRRKLQELQAASNMKQRAVETYEARVRASEKELSERQAEIEALRESLRRSTAKKEKLERRIRKWEQQRSSAREMNGGGLHLEASATPQLFEVAVQGAREAAFGFSKLLVSLMRGAQWDLEAAAESIEPGIGYAKPAHRRFAFESYICHRMFCGFENENFYINGSLSSILDPAKHRAECFLQFRDMRAVDPSDLVGITPECLFGKFCHRKYLQIVHEKMEESFFGGFEQHRDVILAGAHPRTRFYQSFLRFAKAVWLVHRLAFSFDPTASIFQVKRGTQFDPTFMESSAKNVRISDEDEGVRPRVGFTVMPGFRVDKWVIKCQVYLDGMVASED